MNCCRFRLFKLVCFFGIEETDQRAETGEEVGEVPDGAEDTADEAETDDSENGGNDTHGDSADDPDGEEVDEFLLGSGAFEADVFDDLSMISCVEKRRIIGAPAPDMVLMSIKYARKQLRDALEEEEEC